MYTRCSLVVWTWSTSLRLPWAAEVPPSCTSWRYSKRPELRIHTKPLILAWWFFLATQNSGRCFHAETYKYTNPISECFKLVQLTLNVGPELEFTALEQLGPRCDYPCMASWHGTWESVARLHKPSLSLQQPPQPGFQPAVWCVAAERHFF